MTANGDGDSFCGWPECVDRFDLDLRRKQSTKFSRLFVYARDSFPSTVGEVSVEELQCKYWTNRIGAKVVHMERRG